MPGLAVRGRQFIADDNFTAGTAPVRQRPDYIIMLTQVCGGFIEVEGLERKSSSASFLSRDWPYDGQLHLRNVSRYTTSQQTEFFRHLFSKHAQILTEWLEGALEVVNVQRDTRNVDQQLQEQKTVRESTLERSAADRTFAWHMLVRMKTVLPSLLPVTSSARRVKKSQCSATQRE